MKTMISFAQASVFLLVLLILTGCGQGGCTVSSSSSSELTINGRKTISRTRNEVTRRLETTSEVEVKNGKIINFPKAAIIRLEEVVGTETREAELRENGGELELWIKDQGTFRRGSASEQEWLNTFLKEISEE